MRSNSKSSRRSYHVGNLSAQLLTTARSMLEEVGSSKLSMRALCSALDVTPTAAYHHFTNRADLLAQLATEGFMELAEALSEVSASLAAEKKIHTFCLIYLDFAQRNPALYQLMFGPELAVEMMPQELRAARQLAFSKLEIMLADLFKCPIDSIDVRSAALASWSYIHGLTALSLHGVLQHPNEVSNQRIIEFTLAGLELLFKTRAPSSDPI